MKLSKDIASVVRIWLIAGLCMLTVVMYIAGSINATVHNDIIPQNCQYPDRSTNTATHCDNSDPCDPANVKGGSGDCISLVTPIQITTDLRNVPIEAPFIPPAGGHTK